MSLLTMVLLISNAIASNDDSTDILNEIYQKIVTTQDLNHNSDHVFYSLTYGNKLPPDFLIQFPTPQIWGLNPSAYAAYPYHEDTTGFDLPTCNVDKDCIDRTKCMHLRAFEDGTDTSNVKKCVGMADSNLDYIYNTIIKANKFVDITVFNFPDGRFLSTLTNAFTYLASKKKTITIRVFVGYPGPDKLYKPPLKSKVIKADIYNAINQNTKRFISALTLKMKAKSSSQISLYVAGVYTCQGSPTQAYLQQSPSQIMSIVFNHSKLIDVDGNAVLTGGVNMDTKSYLAKDPVFDLMMKIEGPSAAETLNFTNLLWRYVDVNREHSMFVSAYQFKNNSITSAVSTPVLTASAQQKDGDIEILAVGKSGGCIAGAKKTQFASNLAIELLLKQSTKSIYIAQQSLNSAFNMWPTSKDNKEKNTNYMQALASLILNGGSVFIVTSPYENNVLDFFEYYPSLASREMLWNKIKEETINESARSSLTKKQINALLCMNLHIGYAAFSNFKAVWPDKSKVYQHYKFIMVDDRFFYVGSQNFYPDALQNYGFIIDSKKASNQIKQDFWDKYWAYVKQDEYHAPQC